MLASDLLTLGLTGALDSVIDLGIPQFDTRRNLPLLHVLDDLVEKFQSVARGVLTRRVRVNGNRIDRPLLLLELLEVLREEAVVGLGQANRATRRHHLGTRVVLADDLVCLFSQFCHLLGRTVVEVGEVRFVPNLVGINARSVALNDRLHPLLPHVHIRVCRPGAPVGVIALRCLLLGPLRCGAKNVGDRHALRIGAGNRRVHAVPPEGLLLLLHLAPRDPRIPETNASDIRVRLFTVGNLWHVHPKCDVRYWVGSDSHGCHRHR